MSYSTDELYELLPAIYRIRDAEEGGSLRALVAVLAEEAQVLEEDVAQLYENWFIETCQPWVVPYIGDLLSVRDLYVVAAGATFSQRARVANTLAFRRRKGTATMLEQLARDTTGWPARAVEFFELLATTQHFNHVRLHNTRTPDLRDTDRLELLDTAFDTIAHTADVRRIARGRGWHNIPNVGLFLWRLQAYPVPRSQARPAPDGPAGAYRFHPYGLDGPLFNRPRTETEITHLAEEVNVPGVLRRRPLHDELEARREALAEGRTPNYLYFDDRADAEHPPAFALFLDGSDTPISFDEVAVCNLAAWRVPEVPITVAIDPVLGRLVFQAGVNPTRVEVSYAYGFPGDVGSGPYNRRTSIEEALTREVTWQVAVGQDLAADGVTLFNTITDAVAAWNAQPASTVGVIAIVDNGTYAGSLTGAAEIEIDEGSLLLIVAAEWPDRPAIGPVEPDERRAHLLGDVAVRGAVAPGSEQLPGTLVLDGLLIEGAVIVRVGALGGLRLAHTTVGMQDPDAPLGLAVTPSVNAALQNRELTLELDHSLCGPIVVPEAIRAVRLLDSVVQAPRVDGSRGPALAAAGGGAGPPATIERCTLLGSVHVRELTLGSETIFSEPAVADRTQIGCVRFSYVPGGSRTPRRFRCQPTLALQQRANEMAQAGAIAEASIQALPASERDAIEARVQPTFTATRYGHPACTQLSRACAREIRTGAEDGSEMGVWSLLKQPQRLANLEASLDDYLRFGLEAGLILVNDRLQDDFLEEAI